MKKCMLLLMSLFSIFLTGCIKNESESKEVLTICAEQRLERAANDVLDLWKAMNTEKQGKIDVIPQDADTGEIKIASIRTQLMSGKGPDIFLLSSKGPIDSEATPCLFTYPDKLMYTDTFLPLDTFLKNAQYANPKNWNQKVLEAGKTDVGQMILPLTYKYNKYAFSKSELEELNTLPFSWNEMIDCENPLIPNAMFIQAYSFFPLFGQLVDYKNEKLLYSKEEFETRAHETAEFITKNETTKLEEVNSTITDIDTDYFYDYLANSEDEMIILGFPNINGGVTAEIDTYVAVNRNTKNLDDVYTFLDLLFSDEVLCGRGMQIDNKIFGNMFFYLLPNQIVHNQYLKIAHPELSANDLMAIKESDERINAVCFYSDVEKELRNMFQDYIKSFHHGEDEIKRKKIISDTYQMIEMKILE